MDTARVLPPELDAGRPAGKETALTLDKAVETLKEWDILSANEVDLDLRNAVSLGIEALKRIQDRRALNTGWEIPPLPGETE